jgi:(p)ppGpp synthase/HD superfamily hydrolase
MSDLTNLITYVFNAHSVGATEPSKSVRKWDGKTPYAIHPVWCAMTILAETSLPEDVRQRGVKALLLHDILEDTTFDLPEETPEDVALIVRGMTFVSFDEEVKLIWERSDEVKLLKLYDKTSNLLDSTWMSFSKREQYEEYLIDLCLDTEPVYGELNIHRIAKAICDK